ncbi:hypothetical protein HOY82DRAFT_598017 [Tuber indicum]|nr:hypothetical protein HOY82DRAFT_598017 [Tuber indicum]
MPRTSEKARITYQLGDIWLSNAIVQMIFNTSDDLSLFFKCFKSFVHNQKYTKRDVSTNLEIASTLLESSVTTNFNGEIRSEMGVEDSDDGFGKDEMEVIELLAMGVPAIRYLMPRDPIPRSEFMFNHHIFTMSEDRFMAFFRMKRQSFNRPVTLIRDDPIFHNESQNPQASPSVQLATALYILGFNGISTIRGAAQLGIGEGTTVRRRQPVKTIGCLGQS